MNYLVVSIHDAAPPYLAQLKEITAWLDRHSIRPRCIKVVPNFLDRWNILEHRDFLDWLLEEKEKGHEIIQHGYTHMAPENKRGVLNLLKGRLVTNNESEFLHRDYEKAKMALEEGRKILNGAGITCYGFTSPTWFQSREAVKAIEGCGFRFFTTHSAIFDCEKQKRHSSMAMGFQGVNSFLEYLNMFGNNIMRKTGFLCSRVARMVLHPHPVDGNQSFARALKGILQLSKKRKLVTYHQYLDFKSDE